MAGILSYALTLDTSKFQSSLASSGGLLVVSEAQFRSLGATAAASTATAGKGLNSVTSGARNAAASAGSLFTKLSTAGAVASNIVAGAKAMGEAWKFATKIMESGGISGALTRVRAGLAGIARDPGLRRLALGAVAAGTAVLGIMGAIRVVRSGLSGLAAVGAASLSAIRRAASATTASLGAMKNAIPGSSLLGPLAGIGLAAGAFASLSKAADFEQLKISMEVLTGSAEKASKLLTGLAADADKSPFDTAAYSDAGKILIALGGDTNTVRSELSALGDVAAGLSIPLNEMAVAYGKARNDGVLYMETLNQFNDKGIPVMAMLAEKLKVSTVEVKKLASEGQIGFGMLEEVFADLTSEGGKFYGMMARQALSSKGLLTSLKSAFDKLLVTVGTPINDFLKPMLDGNLGRMQLLNQKFTAFFKLMSAARDQGKLGDFVGSSLKLGIMEGINIFSAGVRGVVAYLAAALPPVFQAAAEILASDRMVAFFDKLFTASGQALRSEISLAASGLAESFGLDSLAQKLTLDAGLQKGLSKGNFRAAATDFKNADIGPVLDKIGKSLQDAHIAGVEAAAKASAKPLLNTEAERKRWEALAKSLDPKALEDILKKSVSSEAESLKGLKEILGKLNPPPKPAAPVVASAGPTRLGNRELGGEPAGEPPRRRGQVLDLVDSEEKRKARRSMVDKLKDERMAGDNPFAVRDIQRGPRLINPKRAADALARGAAAADPGQGRRAAAAEAARPDPLFKVVQSIHDHLKNIATA